MLVPFLDGDYINVYRPAPDTYPGPDSENFQAGKVYEEWVPNDFTVLRGEDGWHLMGITHPRPPRFTRPTDCFAEIHEAEWQLFHAFCPESDLRKALHPGSFQQQPLILSAPERPGERPEIWAPIAWRLKDRYILLYSPDPFRAAFSNDLKSWQCGGEVLRIGDPCARDLNIVETEDGYLLVFLRGNSVCVSKSADLCSFETPQVIFTDPTGYSLESPVLKRFDGCWYLFFCLFRDDDLVNGAYDNRTLVYAADTLEGLKDAPCLARLAAHAPEVFQDDAGAWYIASAEWPRRGVNIAPLSWHP